MFKLDLGPTSEAMHCSATDYRSVDFQFGRRKIFRDRGLQTTSAISTRRVDLLFGNLLSASLASDVIPKISETCYLSHLLAGLIPHDRSS